MSVSCTNIDEVETTVVVWNMAHRADNWDYLSGADAFLLSEAVAPPSGIREQLTAHGDWTTSGAKRRRWSTAVAWPSNAPVEYVDLSPARSGTLAAAVVDKRLVLVACYATWEPDPAHPEWRTGRSDWSALQLVDDIAVLQRQNDGLPMIVAGDWNLWPSTYPNPGGCSIIEPVEAAMSKLGLNRVRLTGQMIRAEHRKSTYGTLPEDAVPTFDFGYRGSPRYEVDHVFASTALKVSADAKNSSHEWGPSDHCQIRVRATQKCISQPVKLPRFG